MNDFDALLTRSFAEAHEPVDDGFSVNVSHAVARSENALQIRNAIYSGGMAVAGGAIAYGVYAFTSAFGQELMASAGLEIARAHGALSAVASVSSTTQGFMQSIQALGAIVPQMMLVTAALAGGAVAYRSAQQD